MPKVLLKQVLGNKIISGGSIVRYSDHNVGSGISIFKNACHYALEGIMSKQVDSPYEQKRSLHWLKVKCAHRQEFVIGGYTQPKGSREHFRFLLS